jgi:CubicO group peptidase (beta-lactamase class C family)
MGATVDGLVAGEMQAHRLAGLTIALARQGTIIYAQGYGYADLSDCLPMQAATPFEIGSVTKTFTAAAILQLQSAGTLDIDKPVITYLPSYPFDPRITVRMLLNMTSGLADYLNDPSYFPASSTWVTSGATEQTILTAITHAPLQLTPGTQYQYSNSNYYVLGAIIEAVSGQSYANYLATKITGPLALTQTSLVTQPPAAALPYDANGGLLPVPATSTGFAAGGLWSDVLDLATFDAALLRGRVVPAAQFSEMVSAPSSSNYGMGLVYDDVAFARQFVYQNGKFGAYNAWNGFFLDDGWSISILTNADPTTGVSRDAIRVAQPPGGPLASPQDQFTAFAVKMIDDLCNPGPSSSQTPC